MLSRGPEKASAVSAANGATSTSAGCLTADRTERLGEDHDVRPDHRQRRPTRVVRFEGATSGSPRGRWHGSTGRTFQLPRLFGEMTVSRSDGRGAGGELAGGAPSPHLLISSGSPPPMRRRRASYGQRKFTGWPACSCSGLAFAPRRAVRGVNAARAIADRLLRSSRGDDVLVIDHECRSSWACGDRARHGHGQVIAGPPGPEDARVREASGRRGMSALLVGASTGYPSQVLGDVSVHVAAGRS